MEIEIGGGSEKSLGGPESAAGDQECMGSSASSRSLACHSLFDCLFLLEPVSCRGQQPARSNGKRNRTVELSFTKNDIGSAEALPILCVRCAQ